MTKSPAMSDSAQSEDDLASAKKTILIGVGACALFLLIIAMLFPKPESSVIAPQFASSKAAESPDLVARAWFTSNRVVQDQNFIVEFELENRSNDEVRHVAIDLQTGQAFELVSWSKYNGAQAQRMDKGKWPWIDALDKGAARYQCELRPKADSGSYSLIAVYAYSTPDGLTTHNAVTIGPFQVIAAWRDKLQNLAAAIQTVLTTLILPISLGVLAWYLPHVATSRETKRAKSEGELAETRAQAQQTWNLLLPYSLQASQKYYLPACSFIGGLSSLYPKWEKNKTDEHRHEVLYTLMMFLRHIRAARDEVGGFHFKDRKGEAAAAICWNMLQTRFAARFPLRTRDAVLDALELKDSFAGFSRQYENPRTRQAFVAADEIVKTWLEPPPGSGDRPFGDYLPLFVLFRSILRYEVNRPLQYWYGVLDDSSELQSHTERLKMLDFTEIEGWEDSRREIAKYVDSLPKPEVTADPNSTR